MQLADAGVFTCVAASPAGVTDRNFTLQVHGTDRGGGGGGINVSLGLGRENQAPWANTETQSLIRSVAHSFTPQAAIRPCGVPGPSWAPGCDSE